jgi:hypothetical protein
MQFLYTMRLVSLVSFSLLTTSALADSTPVPARAVHQQTPAVNLVPIVLADLPEACRPIARQAAAVKLATALAGRISLANCLAIDAGAKLPKLCDCAESIAAVDAAIEPSVALLDEVVAAGEAPTQILAEHAKADLYSAMRSRLASTVPPSDGSDAGNALRDSRRAVLDAQLAPWDAAIKTSAEHVVELVKANPKLATNPALETAIESSRRRLARAVATQP